MDIFKPDCVIFEAAEYIFMDSYFDSAGMKDFVLNAPLSDYDDYPVEEKGAYVMAEEGEKLVNITVAGIKAETACGYMISDDLEYDFQRKCDEEGNIYYTTAVERDKYSQDSEFYLIDKNDKIKYKIISQED